MALQTNAYAKSNPTNKKLFYKNDPRNPPFVRFFSNSHAHAANEIPPLFPRQTPIRSARRCLAIKPPHHASITCNPPKSIRTHQNLFQSTSPQTSQWRFPYRAFPDTHSKTLFSKSQPHNNQIPRELKPSTAPSKRDKPLYISNAILAYHSHAKKAVKRRIPI